MIAGIRIVELLSGLVDNRVYPKYITEHQDSTLPYIIYQTISNVPDDSMDGVSGHEWVRVQIDVYHDNYDDGINLANDAVEILNNNIKPMVYGGMTEPDEPDQSIYRQSFDIEFWQTRQNIPQTTP